MTDVLVVGGGQAGLALGYYLRREGVDFAVLDGEEGPGGAWRHGWASLRLFSPASSSSLPGWRMPASVGEAPGRDEVVDYLARYEERYDLPVERPVEVREVGRIPGGFRVETSAGERYARAVVMATGTWRAPRWPELPGGEEFRGRILHSAEYRGPEGFRGRKVAVMGAGNSGVQIVADLLGTAASVHWLCREPPRFLPPDVDGAHLFRQASERYRALKEGRTPPPMRSLGDIVQVPPVRKALEEGGLVPEPVARRLLPGGVLLAGGARLEVDDLVVATGFEAALGPVEDLVGSRPETKGTRSVSVPGLWFVGYGGWTGYASATLVGVGRTARSTAREVSSHLGSE